MMTKLSFSVKQIRLSLLTIAALTAGFTAIASPTWIQAIEYRLQASFLETRGVVTAPDNVLILAIDDDSLSQGANYQADPQQFADLAPIQSWPWRRQAYANVIERLMQAGVKAIAIDVLFTTPSVYGDADDQALKRVLEKYRDRIVLASKYSNTENLQGQVLQYVEPLSKVLPGQGKTGFINLPIAADGMIHHFGERFIQGLEQQSQSPDLFSSHPSLSFASATLTAAKQSIPDRNTLATRSIFYHGPDRTFPQIPFWSALDTNHWQSSLANGKVFQGKIVIIGSTAPSQQDQQPAPFGNSWRYPSPMYGVEIQANAIATLQQQITLQDLWSNPWMNGVWVVAIVAIGGGWTISRKAALQQILSLGLSLTIAGGLSYGLFIGAHRIVPIVAPQLGIFCIGGSGILIEITKRQRQTHRLRESLKSHLTIPAVQAIIHEQEEQDDLRTLLNDQLNDRQQEVQGKLIGGRYKVARLIGQGGFGETYLAQDLQRPGQPECVVKQLKLAVKSSQSRSVEKLQQLFMQEAQALEQLGKHDRIPQLLAYFEEMGEFYLVQELIGGLSLHHELLIAHKLDIGCVLHLLQDILEILDFVHSHHMIHRDIKPSNLMHRQEDGHWVLIDFGIAKQVSAASRSGQPTLAIGTLGYVAPEQALGHPTCSSDLYALGITAIECLTGINATQILELEAQDRFQDIPTLSPELVTFLSRLTHPQEPQRYANAKLAIADLHHIPEMKEIVSPANSLRGWNKAPSTSPTSKLSPSPLDATEVLPTLKN
jgi:CHASE2 domain-containing sensor protein